MGKLIIATSPLSNEIFIGSRNKKGDEWLANRTTVTGMACAAVAQHVLAFGKPVEVSSNGTPLYRITVEDLTPAQQREERE
jgi:hypothetical protein